MQKNGMCPRSTIEVFKRLPQGALAELIDGGLFIWPVPTPKHQMVCGELSHQLHQICCARRLGEILCRPCDVFLDEHFNAVQPDIIFISNEKSEIVKTDAIHGVPDLLIEILSESNAKHDLVRKKALYEKFGVKEYWIIDPETKESIGFTLIGRRFSELPISTGKLSSVLLNYVFEF